MTFFRPPNPPGATGLGAAMGLTGTPGKGFFLTYFRLAVVGSFNGFFLGRPRLRLGGSVSESNDPKKF